MKTDSQTSCPSDLAARGFAALLRRSDIADKRVLLRVDLNLPHAKKQGSSRTDRTDDADSGTHARLQRALPAMRQLADAGARLAVLSHFGRPGGRVQPGLSLKPLAAVLAQALGREVAFASDCIGAPAHQAMRALAPGGIVLMENTRFHAGEEANAPDFVAALRDLGDVFVLDAFSVAHRKHASSYGLARALPSCAGPNVAAEWAQLARLLAHPARPFCAIVGGAKIAGKLPLLERLVEKCDSLILGGGMANSFLFALGHPVGRSLHEPELAEAARHIVRQAKQCGCDLLLPQDVVIAPSRAEAAHARTIALAAMPADAMILDCGAESLKRIRARLDDAKTAVWNGPLGAFETPPFAAATLQMAQHMAQRARTQNLTAIAGGGDSLAALQQAGCAQDFSYVSTAGGAFLAWLQSGELPALRALTAS